MYGHLEKSLNHWNKKDNLVILGDMEDRGRDSLLVVQKIMEISKKYKVVFIMGNHDQMLLDYIDDPSNYERYYRNGGETTIASFCQNKDVLKLDHVQRVNELKQKCKEEIDYLKTGLLYDTFHQVLFTHAGFCSFRHCFEETSDEQFIWIRDHYKHKNESGYINVFGHTPTKYIHHPISNDYWISEDKTYIGIDGGCAYGGQLNGIVIDENGQIVETYSIEESKKNTPIN